MHHLRLTRDDLDTASTSERALQKDQNYALAYVGRCFGVERPAADSLSVPPNPIPKEEAAIRKARSRSMTHFLKRTLSWRCTSGFGAYDWAMVPKPSTGAPSSSTPNLADAMLSYSTAFGQRRPEEGMQQMRRALEIDPFNATYQAFCMASTPCSWESSTTPSRSSAVASARRRIFRSPRSSCPMPSSISKASTKNR